MGAAHTVEIVSSFLGEGYTAHCSCGWLSDEHPENQTALFYGREHQHSSDPDHIDRVEAGAIANRIMARNSVITEDAEWLRGLLYTAALEAMPNARIRVLSDLQKSFTKTDQPTNAPTDGPT
jgi:hypothetical protein